jgi:hypothetical protein
MTYYNKRSWNDSPRSTNGMMHWEHAFARAVDADYIKIRFAIVLLEDGLYDWENMGDYAIPVLKHVEKAILEHRVLAGTDKYHNL